MSDKFIPNNAYDDQTHSGRRLKPRGKNRKPFVIVCRVKRRVSNGLARTLGLENWWVHSRYTTTARRNHALAVLVRKQQSAPDWWQLEYRKVDE